VLPVERLHPGAVAAIRARPPDETVAIACSGGADSVALLLLLWAHLPERRGRWLVLHFDHRLRGAASAADARFVRTAAWALGERCEVGTWDPPAGKVSEAAARDARWRFFEERMKAAGARVIALGHQLDDVAETMLMRLARGSGAGGLAAPRPVQAMGGGVVRARPLLDIAAADLRAALGRCGVPWREDATNRGDVFFRNRVRARVLPALRAASPSDALEGFAASRTQLEEDDEALNRWARELAAEPRAGQPFDVSSLRGRPVAVVRRALHGWLVAEALNDVLARPAVARIVEAVISGAELRSSVGARGWIALRQGRLLVEPAGEKPATASPWPEARLPADGELVAPDGARLAARVVGLTARLRAKIVSGGCDPASVVHLSLVPDALEAGFVVRPWRPGDTYRPLRAPGRAKLQDLFVNRKIPRERRRQLPVVCLHSGAIVWVPGLLPANETEVKSGAKLVVQLTYFPPGNIVRPPPSNKEAHVRSRQT
jgi:tRNA(Ile)-lysidine synthase